MSGIYIHIPFCKQACYYCDFHFSTSLKIKDVMIKAIVKELEWRKKEIPDRVETIYFGGGTPSLLSIDEIQLIISTVYNNYQVIDAPEITLEANPDDLTSKKISELSNSKINRLSIGVQSFFEEDLKFMNRAHNAKEALYCVTESMRFFDNITIDLIYGVPNMSNEKWLKNLQIAFDLGIPHISSYALTVEEKTALSNFIKKGKYPPLDEQLAEQQFKILIEETKKHELVQYEISNFGKKGYFSKHNTSYWQGKHYIGIGPSAHSFNGISRSWNFSNNRKYINSIQNEALPHQIEMLQKNDRFNETLMTGLRTIWGVCLNNVEMNFGKEIKDQLIKNAQKHIINKTLKIEKNKLLITDKGKFLADGITADLFLV
ncbi:MAG: radical SAM family heme chaperone HemW [Flavobacteriaceae bacterium]|nr:radical SAM family heme chaperone HemW [Flavobacteriaceae bacterium]